MGDEIIVGFIVNYRIFQTQGHETDGGKSLKWSGISCIIFFSLAHFLNLTTAFVMDSQKWFYSISAWIFLKIFLKTREHLPQNYFWL